MKFLLYDTETTGLNTKTCGLHQLSGMVLQYDQDSREFAILETFDYHIRPISGKMVTQSALDIGNLTIEQLRAYPEASKVFATFTELLSRHVDKYNREDKFFQVGYNINFDKEVLRQWFTDLGDKYFGSWFWPNVIDLMSDATRILANVRPYMENFKLGSVAEMLGAKVPFDKLHDSMEDVYLTLEIMKKCWHTPTPIPLDDFDYEIIEKHLQSRLNRTTVVKDNTTYSFE